MEAKIKIIYDKLKKEIEKINKSVKSIKMDIKLSPELNIIIFYYSRIIDFKIIYDFKNNIIRYFDITNNKLVENNKIEYSLIDNINIKQIFTDFIIFYVKESINNLKKKGITSKNIIKAKIMNDIIVYYNKIFNQMFDDVKLLIEYIFEEYF